jgi:hypothetical protein
MAKENAPVTGAQRELLAGSVSKDGSMALIEFVGGDHRLWLTIPVESLQNLRGLCEQLEAMAINASKGIAPQWHIVLHSEQGEAEKSKIRNARCKTRLGSPFRTRILGLPFCGYVSRRGRSCFAP